MAPSGSTWWCELCQVTVWVRHVPSGSGTSSAANGWYERASIRASFRVEEEVEDPHRRGERRC